jgi:DNA-binding GntR family transcriptional regulator
MLINFSKLLIDARHQPVWGGLKQRSFTPERHRCYCDEHTEIVDAITDRDGTRAQEAMMDHLAHVRTNLLG